MKKTGFRIFATVTVGLTVVCLAGCQSPNTNTIMPRPVEAGISSECPNQQVALTIHPDDLKAGQVFAFGRWPRIQFKKTSTQLVDNAVVCTEWETIRGRHRLICTEPIVLPTAEGILEMPTSWKLSVDAFMGADVHGTGLVHIALCEPPSSQQTPDVYSCNRQVSSAVVIPMVAILAKGAVVEGINGVVVRDVTGRYDLFEKEHSADGMPILKSALRGSATLRHAEVPVSEDVKRLSHGAKAINMSVVIDGPVNAPAATMAFSEWLGVSQPGVIPTGIRSVGSRTWTNICHGNVVTGFVVELPDNLGIKHSYYVDQQNNRTYRDGLQVVMLSRRIR